LDIGWQISPQLTLNYTGLGPTGVSFTWNSSSFFDYRVQRGSNLISFPDGNASAAGNGNIQAWTDPAPPASMAFYRLSRSEVFPTPQNSPTSLMVASRGFSTTDSEEARLVSNCGYSGH
jgi:hypothetical protein